MSCSRVRPQILMRTHGVPGAAQARRKPQAPGSRAPSGQNTPQQQRHPHTGNANALRKEHIGKQYIAGAAGRTETLRLPTGPARPSGRRTRPSATRNQGISFVPERRHAVVELEHRVLGAQLRNTFLRRLAAGLQHGPGKRLQLRALATVRRNASGLPASYWRSCWRSPCGRPAPARSGATHHARPGSHTTTVATCPTHQKVVVARDLVERQALVVIGTDPGHRVDLALFQRGVGVGHRHSTGAAPMREQAPAGEAVGLIFRPRRSSTVLISPRNQPPICAPVAAGKFRMLCLPNSTRVSAGPRPASSRRASGARVQAERHVPASKLSACSGRTARRRRS